MRLKRVAFAVAVLAPRAFLSSGAVTFGAFNADSDDSPATYIVSHHKSGALAAMAIAANLCCREALNISVRGDPVQNIAKVI